MAYTRTDIVEWVLMRMDEIAPTAQFAIIPSTSIERELDEAATAVIRSVPKEFLFPIATDLKTSPAITNYVGSTLFSVIIPIASTFQRLIRLRLTHWSSYCDKPVTMDSIEYKRQFNLYQKADTARPVCAIIPFSVTVSGVSYSLGIETFPPPTTLSTLTIHDNIIASTSLHSSTTAFISDFSAVFTTVVESMPTLLVEPTVWLAAGRCLAAVRAFDTAKVAFDNYTASLGLLAKGGM